MCGMTILLLSRWVVYPTTGNLAYLTLSMAPGNPVKLEAKVKTKGKAIEDVLIPVCGLKLFKGGKGT